MIRTPLAAFAAVLIAAACSPAADTPAAPQEPADASAAPAGGASGAAVAGPLEMSCAGPFTATTTEADLRTRFGADAVKIETVPGPEGTTLTGGVIHGADPARRLEAIWWDDARTQLSVVRARDGATAVSLPGGVHVGSTLAELQTANGGPFTISGFGWDYGGGVTGWRNGKLQPAVQGCSHGVELVPAEDAADYAQGDSEFASDDASVIAAKATVGEISVGFAAP